MKSKWITGKCLVQKWDMKDFEIVEPVKQGLQPYDDIMKPILPPGVAKLYDIIREHKEDIASIEERFPEFKNKYRTIEWWCELNIDTRDKSTGKYKNIDYPDGSDTVVRAEYETKRTEIELLEAKLSKYPDLPCWKGYELPGRSKDIRTVVSSLLDSFFKLDDILLLEEAVTCEDPSSSKDVTVNNLSQRERDKILENAFIRRGDFWEIWYQGKKLPNLIKDMDGLVYIAYLLRHPPQVTHVSDLYKKLHPIQDEAMMSEGELSQSLSTGEMRNSAMALEILDPTARMQIGSKIHQLKEDIENAESDLERREGEKELKNYYTSLGIDGINALSLKSMKINESVKKNADAVRNAINGAIKKIHMESPDLADYLKKKSTISSGSKYMYIGQVNWDVTL